MPGNTRSRTGAALTALVILTLIPLIASAQVRFNVPAEPMGKALEDLASQADLNVYYDRAAVAGLTARALRADLTPKVAFARLLAGTRLTAVYVDEDTVRVVSKKQARRLRKAKEIAARQIGDSAVGHADPRGRHDDPAGSSQSTGPHENPRENHDYGEKHHKKTLNEVLITGSRIPTLSKDEQQEVRIYDRAQINRSGQTSIADFLSTLPSVSTRSDSTAFGYVPTVQLRGLPVGTTLVLLNGRRLENSALANGGYFDLNNIPLAAVQRVEVDTTGSSAVYGSDAIGGIVNIILKKGFDGFAANAKYNWAKDFGAMRTSVAIGKQWRRGGLELIGSYGIDSGLLESSRFLTASNNYTYFGGLNYNLPVCFPGNVFSTSGAPLPGAPAGSSATYAAVTGATVTGKPTLSQFSYGTLNQCEFLGTADLLPSKHRAGVFVRGHLRITSTVQLFTELMYTHVSVVTREGDQFLFGLPGFQAYSVSASNPYNPFGTSVGVASSIPGAPVTEVYDTDFFRPLIGIKGILANRWHWELSAWQSSDWTRDTTSNLIVNSTAIQNALNSSSPGTALNPFVNGPIGPQSLLSTMFSNARQKMMGRDRSVEAYIRGRIVQLPAGSVQAVVGGNYVRSVLAFNEINNDQAPPNTRLNFRRTYSAVFGEVRIPLIALHTRFRSGPLLRISLATRHDHYSDFGSDTTKQVGLSIRPTDNILVRGTYADAFAAPTLPSLNNPQIISPAIVIDPRNGTPSLVQLVTGGNGSLKPLRGQTHTVGIIYSSERLRGLRLSATQWQISEHNNIQSVTPQVIVNNFQNRVIRNSSGAIARVIDTEINFGTINVAGIDYGLDYHVPISRGRISVALNATETYHYEQALVPGSSSTEAVSVAQNNGDWAPKWKGTAGIGWSDDAITGYLDGRYTASYQDYDSTRRIGNFWIFDTNWRWNIDKTLRRSNEWLKGSYVEVGAINLFNRAPQFSNYNFDAYGFDASQMSILGRSIYIDVGVQY